MKKIILNESPIEISQQPNKDLHLIFKLTQMPSLLMEEGEISRLGINSDEQLEVRVITKSEIVVYLFRPTKKLLDILEKYPVKGCRVFISLDETLSPETKLKLVFIGLFKL